MQTTTRTAQRSLTPTGGWLRYSLPWACALVLFLVNAYVCREAFYRQSTGHLQSMHGEWMALARLGHFTSWKPTWWPWWGAGVPLEYTYAPLVPGLIALLARLEHAPLALAFNQLSGIVYCLTPVTLFLASWRLSGRTVESFVAALACSLLTPVSLIVPDVAFRWSLALEARRFYLLFDWDDLPHILSLTLFPLLVWALALALRRRNAVYGAMAGLLMAAMMLANMFGAVLVVLAMITVPLTVFEKARIADFGRAAGIAACAYILVCPWLPPSLLMTIRANSVLDGEAAKTSVSLIALGVIALVAANVRMLVSRAATQWAFRWLAVAGSIVFLIPVLDYFASLHFVPQAGRYKLEADLAIIWMVVFTGAHLFRRLPLPGRAVLLVPLLFVGVHQIRAYRQYARNLLAPVDLNQRVEYRAVIWTDEHLKGQRVMLTGSTGLWADAYRDVTQLAAEPYTTTPNRNQFLAAYIIQSGDSAGNRDAAVSVLWLKAFGAQAIEVPGAHSPDFWKPFPNPAKFDGVLPLIWREQETSIYAVPSAASTSLAHVVKPGSLVKDPPVHGLDTAQIERYVTALERPDASQAVFRWEGTNRAVIDAQVAAGDVVSTQITYHRGWHASANGLPVPIQNDGLGLIYMDPRCTGACHIVLDYDGGAELRTCRLASAGFSLLLVITAAGRGLTRRRSGG